MDGVFIPTLLGAAIGVVAGSLVQYFTNIAFHKWNKKRRYLALHRELKYNLTVIDRILTESTAWKARMHIDPDATDKYIMPFSEGLHVVSDELFSNGELYHDFGNDEIQSFAECRAILTSKNKQLNWELIKNTKSAHDAIPYVELIENRCRKLKGQLELVLERRNVK